MAATQLPPFVVKVFYVVGPVIDPYGMGHSNRMGCLHIRQPSLNFRHNYEAINIFSDRINSNCILTFSGSSASISRYSRILASRSCIIGRCPILAASGHAGVYEVSDCYRRKSNA